MKILVITHSYGLNGAAVLLKSIVKYWSQSLNWKIDALVNEQTFSRHEKELTSIGVTPLLNSRPLNEYQFVLINTFIDRGYIDSLFGRVPIIFWIHEGSSVINNANCPPIEIINALSKPDLLLFVTRWQSDSVFRSFIHHLPPQKIAIVSPGIEPFDKKPSNSISRSTNFHIVALGSVYPRKRPLDLAKAVVTLSRSHKLICSFIGDLSHVDAYGNEIKEYLTDYSDTLKWLGGIEENEKLNVLFTADIACFPSGDETFGMSALELASLELPIILADLPVYNEVGWIHGINCLKHPIGDVVCLEKNIEELINNPSLRNQLAKTGSSLAKQYSMDAFYLQITNAVLPIASAINNASEIKEVCNTGVNIHAEKPNTSLPLEQKIHALIAADQLEEAEQLLRPLVANGVGPIPVWRYLATILRRQGRTREAKVIQEMIVQSLPGDLSERFNLSETLLLLGEFDRGWREYCYRYSLSHTKIIERKIQQPSWEGQPIPGQTLLIHDEQGYGDTFQFIRLVKIAKERSQARIILEINREAYAIVKRSLEDVDELIPAGQLPPAFHQHCELMSLPAAMGLQLSDLPGSIPYLKPDPVRVEHWQKRLANVPRPIVALVWAGRPTHTNDANRSIKLIDLSPLVNADISYIALQKGPASDQALNPPEGMNILPLDTEINDFDDTAAILCVADMLISVDSSPVHLAGALGRPAWVMLPFVPDWRWLIEREDSPWYPQLRLFRQSTRGNWQSVFGQLSEALKIQKF